MPNQMIARRTVSRTLVTLGCVVLLVAATLHCLAYLNFSAPAVHGSNLPIALQSVFEIAFLSMAWSWIVLALIVLVVGVSTSDYPNLPDMSEQQVHAQAAERALADAGVEFADLDGYATTGFFPMFAVGMCEYFGIRPHYVDETNWGGASFEVRGGLSVLTLPGP